MKQDLCKIIKKKISDIENNRECELTGSVEQVQITTLEWVLEQLDAPKPVIQARPKEDLPIGTVFNFENPEQIYEVVLDDYEGEVCSGCGFMNNGFCSESPRCQSQTRSDGENVIFKNISK